LGSPHQGAGALALTETISKMVVLCFTLIIPSANGCAFLAAPYLFSLQLFRFHVKYVFHAPEGHPIIVGGRLPVRTLLIRWASQLQSVQRGDFLAKVTPLLL